MVGDKLAFWNRSGLSQEGLPDARGWVIRDIITEKRQGGVMRTKCLVVIGWSLLVVGLGGCSWVESNDILVPSTNAGWIERKHPPQAGAPPYAFYEQHGIRFSVNPPVLGGVTMIGPGYFPVVPVPQSKEKVTIVVDVETDVAIALDPRQITLRAPCGPGAKPSGDDFVHTIAVTDYDIGYAERHPGIPPSVAVKDFPATLEPKHLWAIQITIDAKPDKFTACTVRFGNLAGASTSIPDLSFKRGHLTHWDWD